MPSSPHIVSTGMSNRSISRRSMAIAHGACTGVPNGLRMQTRQSPISSRKRSTTTVRSSGTAPVASTCSVEVQQHVAGGERVERVVRHQPLDRRRVVEVADLADERAERPTELERAARPVAVPERHLARLPGRRA